MLNTSVNKSLPSNDGITATHIYTHRNDADKRNAHELAKLQGQKRTLRSIVQSSLGEESRFKSSDVGEGSYLLQLQHHCPAKTLVTLKRGAQVILVKTINADIGLVNGLRGVVTQMYR